jgi:hypothetical protein
MPWSALVQPRSVRARGEQRARPGADTYPPATICAHDLAKGDDFSAIGLPCGPSCGSTSPVSRDCASFSDGSRSEIWRAPGAASYTMAGGEVVIGDERRQKRGPKRDAEWTRSADGDWRKVQEMGWRT